MAQLDVQPDYLREAYARLSEEVIRCDKQHWDEFYTGRRPPGGDFGPFATGRFDAVLAPFHKAVNDALARWYREHPEYRPGPVTGRVAEYCNILHSRF